MMECGSLHWRRFWPTLAAAGGLFLAAGCATPGSKMPKEPVFFPPPPAQPRIQFLTSFSDEGELREGRADAFATFVTGEKPAGKPIVKPYGLALHQGQLYVCDTVLRSVEVIDLTKRRLRYFTPTGEGEMRMPINIAVDADGTRYLTDTTRGQVLIYGANDRYLGALGDKEEWRPVGIAVAGDRLLVTDLKQQKVWVYDKARRELLFTFPREKEEPAKLYQPTNVTVDQEGNIYVGDTGGFRVQKYDAQGNHLRTFGQRGEQPGMFMLPKGVAVDRAGRVYAVDASFQLVQIFDAEGRLLLFYGQPQSAPVWLTLPASVLIDYEHVHLFQKYAAPGFKLEYLIFITSQYGERKVSVYGFGQKP